MNLNLQWWGNYLSNPLRGDRKTNVITLIESPPNLNLHEKFLLFKREIEEPGRKKEKKKRDAAVLLCGVVGKENR